MFLEPLVHVLNSAFSPPQPQGLEMMTSWVGGVVEVVVLATDGAVVEWAATETDLVEARQTSENLLMVS